MFGTKKNRAARRARATATRLGKRILAATALGVAAVLATVALGAATVLATTPAATAALQSSAPQFGAVQSAGPLSPVRGEFAFFGAAALPIDEFRSHVDLGGGGGLGGIWLLDGAGMIGLRVDGAFLIYGYKSEQRPFSSTVREVSVDVRTTNYIVSGGVGPQIYMATGPVRPFVYATVGVSYFATETSVSGTSFFDDDDIASTTNLHDTSLALTGGGGFSIRLSRGVNPVSLELGASYQYNGETEYLTSAPTVTDYRRGRFTPITSETNMVILRAGVTLGMR